jgi:single-strand DNA-binding protein
MAGDTQITVVGNLVSDPELRYTPTGVAVANFRVASTPRTFDRQANEWKDGDSLFLTCNVWRQAAENVAEALRMDGPTSSTSISKTVRFSPSRVS